ncbi:MAG: Calcineurin-like phosphoesterase [Methanobacterium sp. PtaB.Bin024]|jgi:serine/threonine-protein phosphatase PP1 catalytic subunit|nr:MAG: Calcineurin-like phosphoesterase [Methanobacterium sp. PtaB.Bin024]
MRRIINLPPQGKALIITDLHGNLEDYQKYQKLWDHYLEEGHNIVLTGDLIHSTSPEKDGSVDMLESVMDYCQCENFHFLLGNHECCHIIGKHIYKGLSNQKEDFEEQLKIKFGYRWVEKLDEYVEFFKTLPFAVKTCNGVIISHGGPPQDFTSLEELECVTEDDYIFNEKLTGLLWRREFQYTEDELELFLEHNQSRFHVVGHSPVDGFKVSYDKQLILSSSYSRGRKAYLELDLEIKLEKMSNLTKLIRLLE